jgi:hypothetical protein
MRRSERHPILAVLRDLLAMPALAFAVYLGLGELLWLSDGRNSAAFCDGGAQQLEGLGFLVWIAGIIGSIWLSRPRGRGERIALALWNVAATAPGLFLVLIVFAVGVGHCNE